LGWIEHQLKTSDICMEKRLNTGLKEALELTLERISPLESETIDLFESVDRVTAEELFARIDSPSVDASLKDGYAVLSREVAHATPDSPVRLKLSGCAAAGGRQSFRVEPATTVQVLTGAKIPDGADAVVAGEFAKPCNGHVLIENNAEPGRNILARGSDVTIGQSLVKTGCRLTPGMVGLLAAAGHSRITAVRAPVVAIIATGDEIVAPGQSLPAGKLYASNITMLGAWCRRYGMRVQMAIVKDEAEDIADAFKSAIEKVDTIITSGGAWTGDRDLVAHILERLGWDRVFHRIRIGPGKAVGFGLLAGKPVFILPGGPPSNLMGFLQIALPGIMRLAGHAYPGLPGVNVRLASDLRGMHLDWTQFIYGTIEMKDDYPLFHSLSNVSRLRSMAEAEAIVAIPEGKTVLSSGSVVSAQMLDQFNTRIGDR
jgi:molybdopterin molybdotransferase